MEARDEPVEAGRVFAGEIRGRIVLQRDDSLTIEFVTVDEIDWSPEAPKLELRDGTIFDVAIVAESTTKAGRVPGGRVLRVTVRWTSGPLTATPASVTITFSGGSITVML